MVEKSSGGVEIVYSDSEEASGRANTSSSTAATAGLLLRNGIIRFFVSQNRM